MTTSYVTVRIVQNFEL